MKLPVDAIADFSRGAARPPAVSRVEPLLVLVGPTASGKTALSIDIAWKLKEQGRAVEIINADSRQLYRHLNIGTAKVTKEEMRGVPHHLLSVLDPKEEVTAAWYKREAERLIREIHARGNVPFLVGGSMLYVSAIIDNLQFAEKSDPLLRAKFEKEYERDGGASLYRRLQKEDPETAQSFDRRNKPYVIRACEILESAGKPSAAKKRGSSPYNLFIMGLKIPREELIQRIGKRVERMFAEGWIDEVAGLLKRGYTVDDPGLLSHGYREIAMTLASGKMKVESGKWNIKESGLPKEIAAKTRQYAKRQMTWWRKDTRIRWITEKVACPAPASAEPSSDG